MERAITLEQARARYPHRYTMEHIPNWVRYTAARGGKHFAPHFRTDREWYENTIFPGEKGLHGNCKHCHTTGQTWPMGQWLDECIDTL